MSRISGVLSLGPSSNVSARAFRVAGPRHTDGPNTTDERPRTAHAMQAVAAPATRREETGRTASEPLLEEDIHSDHSIFVALRHYRPLFRECPLHAHHLGIRAGD